MERETIQGTNFNFYEKTFAVMRVILVRDSRALLLFSLLGNDIPLQAHGKEIRPIMLYSDFLFFSKQWRVQDFPEMGARTLRWGNTQFCQILPKTA